MSANLFLLPIFLLVLQCKAQCGLSSELKDEIASYAPIVNKIVDYTTNGDFKGQTYNELAKFIDTFGPRPVGSKVLEDSIDYMMDLCRDSGLENVHGEDVEVTSWYRGTEFANLILPREKTIAMLGLTNSVGTPIEGILADVLVVTSFEDLAEKASLASGKIVVYNVEYISYGVTGQYRARGAVEAARVGAVAALIRSITPFSMATPHTGLLLYEDDVVKIPAAAITAEDANMLQRMQERGNEIKIHLRMDAQMLPDELSRNTVAELPGSTNPEKIIIVSGNIDTVDVSDGAMNNGGAVFISWAAAAVLKRLDLTPKRTIRSVFWTAEEIGGVGLNVYQEVHKNESDNILFVLDSDVGTFTPLGLQYSAGEQGGCILEEILKLLEPVNATRAEFVPDLSLWPEHPMASLYNENDEYFWYHQSVADTMDVEDPDALDKCTAVWTSVSYILADLSIDFPRN